MQSEISLNILRTKNLSVFDGAPFKPSKKTMTFSAIFFSSSIFLKQECILYKLKIFFTKICTEKKIKFVAARSSNCSVTVKFCPMLVKNPYSGGVINQKKNWTG